MNEAENNNHVPFGEKAALDIIRVEMNGHSTSNTVLDTLFKRIMAHANGTEQSDDITMVHLRYIGGLDIFPCATNDGQRGIPLHRRL